MSTPTLDLILTTDTHPGRYIVTYGTQRYPIEFRPETDVALGDALHRLPQILVGGTDSAKQLGPTELLHTVGTRLWHVLLPNGAPAAVRTSLARDLRQGTATVRLNLPASLAVLPWELLCDPQQAADQGFLALRRPLVRLVTGGADLPLIAPPLRVLLLIAAPPRIEQHRMDVESERAAVEQATRAFREAGLLHLRVEDSVTPPRVLQALMQFKPHIVQYIGYGGYAEEVGGFLEWEDEQGEPFRQSDAKFADLLRPRGVRLVVLQGCETATSDRHTDFTGVAGSLLDAGVPAVLAQQAKFTYESSQRASAMLYTALTSGLSIAEASFALRQALVQAERFDWAVPILRTTAGGAAVFLDTDAAAGGHDPALDQRGAATSLPAPTGVFVGRQVELRALRTLLERAPGSGAVLALITGPGGVGKSTLAAQALRRYGKHYPMALTLSCAGFQGFGLLLKTIAEFLHRQGAPLLLESILPDPKLSPTAKAQVALEELERIGPCLLIIDNLESAQAEDRTLTDPELLDFLHRLLTGLQRSRAIITGRYAVKGLLPNGNFAASLLRLDLDDLSGAEIRQLLARHPALATLGAVVVDTLVAEFGGLPYVYDLLHSQANRQRLAAIIHDIQGRITTEQTQYRATEWAAVRQRVVEFATLDTTVAHLTPAARTLLGQLSVFRRAFPLEAMTQGLGATKAAWQLLLDAALLRYNALNGTYRLHSLTATYATNMLASAALVQARMSAAVWYEQYVNTSHNLLDMLEAHQLFLAVGDAQRAGAIANGVAETLSRFGLYTIWRTLCITTMNTADGSLVAEAQRQLGMIAHDQGQDAEARRCYAECLVSFERLGDQGGRANTLHSLGLIAYDQGLYAEARRLYTESLAIKERLDDQGGRATTLHSLGNIAYQQGQYNEARQLYAECLAIKERLGDQRGRAATLHQLGLIAHHQGQYAEAHQLYAECLAIKERLDDQGGRATILHQLGLIAHDQGQYAEARRLYAESLAITERLGDQGKRAATLHQLGNIAQAQGQYAEARRRYAESLAIMERLGDQGGRANTLHQLGNIAYEQGQYAEAEQHYAECLANFERLGDQGGRVNTLHQLGRIAHDQGLYAEARQLYAECLASFERLGDQRGRANTLHQLGLIAHDQGQDAEARQLYAECLASFERLGDQRGRANTLHSLGLIAYDQGQYNEARRRYTESLAIKERLGDQRGRATTLGQLGRLVSQQGDLVAAVQYIATALAIFEQLRSPQREVTLQMLTTLRQAMGESAFTAAWQEVAGGRAVPVAPPVDPHQDLLQRLVAFIQAPNWNESQRMVTAQPDLLSVAAEALLSQLAEVQKDEATRQLIVQHQRLLARCREVGVPTAFAELQTTQPPAAEDANTIIQQVLQDIYALMLQGTTLQRQQLATQLADLQPQLPADAAPLVAFLGCLSALLRGETVAAVGALEEPFSTLWHDLQAALVRSDTTST